MARPPSSPAARTGSARRRRAREVVDVAVLGEDVAVALRRRCGRSRRAASGPPAAPRARARCTCSRSRSAPTSPRGGRCMKRPCERAGLRLVPDDVERLAGVRRARARPGRRSSSSGRAAARRPRSRSSAGSAREQAVERARRIVGVEDRRGASRTAAPRRGPRRSTARPTAGRDRPGPDSGSSRRAPAPARGRSARSCPSSQAASSGRSQRFAPAPRNGTTSPSASTSATSEKCRSSTFTSLLPTARRLGRRRSSP